MNIQQYQASKNNFAWCKFEARQQNSIIIEYVVLLLQLGILGIVAIAINRAKRLGQLNQLSNIYKLICGWLLCFFIKTLLNILAYLQYIGLSEDHPDNSNSIKTALKVLSSTFFLFDLLTTFFIQTAMIYIPYLWISNALKAVTDEHFSLQQQKAISYRLKVRNTIKKYMLIRLLYPFLYLSMCLLLILVDGFYIYTHFFVIIATIQSLVIICVYFSGYLTYSLLKDKLFIDKKALKSMLIQYLILMICCLIRIIINTMFYFSSLIDYEPDANCYDNHSQGQTAMNCIFLSLALLLMHFIPGLVILYVYWPSQDKERSLTDSLLVRSNQHDDNYQTLK